MKRRYRLTRSGDFQRVLAAGRLYSGKSLVAFATLGPGPGIRFGITTSREVRGSVRRNRARRRLREVVRKTSLGEDSAREGLGISYDVVLIARPAALKLPFTVLEEEAGQALGRLRSRA